MSLLSRLFGTVYMASHLRGQARYPFKPLAAIEADQARRVRATVAYAYRYVPYYRETMDRLGMRPADFQCADDLAKLPLLEREQLQRDPEYFVSTAQPLKRYLRLRNSGSTGAPCTFYHDTRALYQYAAQAGRARGVSAPLIGRSVGYRKTLIFPPQGAVQTVQRFYSDHTLLPPGVALHRQHLSMLDPPETNLPLINAFAPDVIHSNGSYLTVLFSYLNTTGKPFHRPKALLYTSDSMVKPARRLAHEGFHVPVFSIYEAVEAYNIGFECEEHTGLHLNTDLCPVRIVDAEGETLPFGESGNVVISNLVNRATVLLNYPLGDIASLLPSPCPCGRSLPLLSQLEGRSVDWMELASGQVVHPAAVDAIFKHHEQIWQYQVVQETPTHFRVALVPAQGCDRQRTREHVAAGFARTFGRDTSVAIRFVDAVERTESGKVRPLISLCRSRQILPGAGADDG